MKTIDANKFNGPRDQNNIAARDEAVVMWKSFGRLALVLKTNRQSKNNVWQFSNGGRRSASSLTGKSIAAWRWDRKRAADQKTISADLLKRPIDLVPFCRGCRP